MDMHIDIIAYIEKDLSAAEIKKAVEHLKTCQQCHETLELFQRSEAMISWCQETLDDLKAEVAVEAGMPPKSGWLELPDSLKTLLSKKEKTKIRMMKALLAMVSKTSKELDLQKLMPTLEVLANSLSAFNTQDSVTYAFDRRHADIAPTDLELRTPPCPSNLHIQIDEYRIEMKTDQIGTRIRITRDGEPLEGGVIAIGKKNEGQRILKTDNRGEVII